MNCSILTPEGKKTVTSSLRSEFKQNLTEEKFLDIINAQFNSIYEDEPNSACVDEFKNILSGIISSPMVSLKYPWILKYKSLQVLDSLINPNNVQDRQADSNKSKQDNIDGTDYADSSDTFIYQTYGYTSMALADMKQRFNKMLADSVLFDVTTGEEVVTQKQLNKNIAHYLEELWKNVYSNIPLNLEKRSVFLSTFEIARVKQYFENFSPEAINALYEDSLKDPKKKNLLDAFQSYFILINFDNLIKSFYSNLIEIDPLRFGPEHLINPCQLIQNYYKYQVSGLNYNLENNWSSEAEVNDVVEETSDIVKLFFNSRVLLDRTKNDAPIRNLNIREITYVWGLIKKHQFDKESKIPFNEVSIDKMLNNDYLTQEEHDYLLKVVVNEDGTTDTVVKSMYDLLQETYSDGTFVIPLIFKLLAADKKYDLNINIKNFKSAHNDLVYSIYKQTFDPSAKIRQAWESRNIEHYKTQPKSFYQYITHYFNNQSHIPMTQYEQDVEGNFEIKTLGKASLGSHTLYYQDQINGNFSAIVDQYYDEENFNKGIKKFNGFTLDRTTLSTELDKSFISIKFNGGKTILKVTPSLTVTLSKDGGKTFKSINNIDLTKNSNLCEFIKDILNLNVSNFEQTFLPSLSITQSELLETAAIVLYNYSVSCESIKTETLVSAKNTALKYYQHNKQKDIRMQKDSKEVQSFPTNVMKKSVESICNTLDILNGVMREASAKGADGNTINTMSTSQLMDKTCAQIYRGEQLGEDYLGHDLEMLHEAYSGYEIARDLKATNGDNKKVTEFTPAESGAFDFVYDFCNAYLSDDENAMMRVLPCVISDKPRVLKLLINLHALKNGKKIKDLSLDEIKQITKEELGSFYKKSFNAIEKEWLKLNQVSKGNVKIGNYKNREDVIWFLNIAKSIDLFGLESNFNGINKAMDLFIEDKFKSIFSLDGSVQYTNPIYQSIKNDYIIKLVKNSGANYNDIKTEVEVAILDKNSDHYKAIEKQINKHLRTRASDAVINLLHTLEITQQEKGKPAAIATSYSFISDDKLHFRVNYIIAQELFKWGVKDESWFRSHVPNETLANTSYKNSEEFFKKKNEQWVRDFIQDGGYITTTNQFSKITPGILEKLVNFENHTWARGGKLVLAKLTYTDFTKHSDNGSESDETDELTEKDYSFGITDLESLRKIGVINYAFENAKYYLFPKQFEQYVTVEQWITSPEFSFTQLVDVLNAHYQLLDKERSNQKVAKEILDTKIANVNSDSKIHPTRKSNLTKKFEKHFNNIKKHPKIDHKISIQIHPLIEKFNTLGYLFGQEYMNTSVGSYAQHPGKNHKNIRAYAAQAYAQQTKRNVIESGTKHQFQLNELDGLPSDVKMATIQNTRDSIATIFGQEANPLDDDGAMYANGITNYLENLSLKGSAVGVDKKDIIWSQNPQTGINKFVKCASFPVTNMRIRDSKFYRYLNYRGLRGKVSELIPFYQGKNQGLDITKNYLGGSLNFDMFSFKRVWLGNTDAHINYLQVYDENDQPLDNHQVYNGDIVTVTNVVFNPETGFTEFLANGVKQKVLLKDVHDIWLFFGGAYSMNLSEDQISGKQEIKGNEYDESSFKYATYVVNSVGKALTSKPTSQKNVNQYLKKAMIHYFPTHEATKSGSTNQNQKSFLYDLSTELAYTDENLYDAGPQLNAEHESDESVLSMMTQVLNALGLRGYTAEQANRAYQALRSLTQITLKDFIDSIDYSKVGNIDRAKSKIENFITLVIFKTLKPGKTSANPETLADLLVQQALQAIQDNKGVLDYETIKQTLPIDNSVLLRQMMSKISATLVKSCIKLKFPGTMDVLSPSNGIFKLYDGRLLSYYEGQDINDLPNKPVTDLADIELGTTYYVPGYYEGDVFKVNTPKDYYLLRQYIEQTGSPIEEIISKGRDLAGYNVKFKDINGNSYNIWDLAIVKQAWRGSNKDEIRETLQNALFSLSNYYDQDTVVIEDSIGNVKEIQLDKSSIKVKPYEIITSKLYQSQFGLRTNDDVKDISENDLFFFERSLEEKVHLLDSQFDVELITIDGNNKYLITDDVPKGFRKLSFTPVKDEAGKLWYLDYKNNPVEQLSSEEDEIYSNGKVRLIKTKNIDFYLNSIKHVRVNISSRIKSHEKLADIIDLFDKSDSKPAKFFVKKFDSFIESGTLDDYTIDEEERQVENEFINKIIHSEEGVKAFSKFISGYRSYEKAKIKNIQKILKNNDLTPEQKRVSLEDLKSKDKWLENQLKSSKEIHTSFLKSLEILAARIPAQCMQSFMSMKIVGFDESGLNTAYVSRYQIYLQGSDFDIDKVSLLGFKFKNGEFIKWSPFMDLSSKELLEASENLPFPTGKEIQYAEVDDNGTIQSICNDIFEQTDNGLIFKTSVENIKKLSTLLNTINKLGGIPQDINIKGLENIINKHNLYINKPNVDVSNALINFVSSSMYNIGKDAVNQIQGEESVDSKDGAVNTIKDLSADLPYSKKLDDVDPGSLTSHYRTRALTMGGKTDTGIVASSLKVFEAYYQYVCNILNNGSQEDKANLLINQEICGKLVKLIANSHQQLDTELPPEVAQALNEIDQSVDAALLYSGFLSLATDNAKDPTLPKINAQESMIGLYLAGVTLGLDVKTLINLLTSEPALKIANLIPANFFTGASGYPDVKSVLKFIKIGPKDFDLDNVLNKMLRSFNELPDFFKNNPTVKNLEKLTTEQYKTFEKCLTASAVKKSTLDKIKKTQEQLRDWSRLKDSVTFSTFLTSDGQELNAFDEIQKLCFMLGEMQSFTMGARLNQGLPNSLSEQINWIRRFEGILSSRVDTIQSLQGGITSEVMNEILQPLQDYNRKLMSNDGVTDDLLIKPNLNQVDFLEFVKNSEYQQLVIDTYDKLKFGVNIFKAFVTVPHYHGYMQTAAALFTLTSSMSSVWNMTNFISKYYLNSMRGDKTSREKLLSSTIDYINGSFIDEFLKTYDFGFGEGKLPNSGNTKVLQEQSDGTLKLVNAPTDYNFTLGTYEGNMTFKYIFEQFVIPSLKSKYPNNELLKSLGFIKTDKTLDKNTLIKLATQTKLLPENTYEEEQIAHYKQGLNIIKDVKIPELGNIHFLDALYVYNLIVNQNAVRENSLTTLFESYMFDTSKKSFEGQTDLIQKFFDFQKTSPDYIFAKIKQFGKNDLINFLKKIAPIDNNFTTGLPYIRKVNPATGKTVLLELDPNKHKKQKSLPNDDSPDIDYDQDNSENDESSYSESGEYDEEAAQALENQRKSFFLRQIDESNYYVIDNTITNPTVVNNLSMSTIKEQVIPVNGELTEYKEITWNNIKDLEKVKILGAKSMTDLFIKLGIMNKLGSQFIRDISAEDLMDILKTDC